MNENSPKINLKESDLLEFALRLATYPNDSRTQNAQLLPGQLPDQLPVDIPIPEGSRVLGSLIRNPEKIDIFLDKNLSPEQVFTFYNERMKAAGWQTTDIFQPDRGGLMEAGARSRGGTETFYRGLRDPAVTVNALDDDNLNRSGHACMVSAYPGRGNVTDIRLNLDMQSPLPPGPYSHMRPHRSRPTNILLPVVEAPEGAILRFCSGGYMFNSAHQEASLETNLDLSTLAAHYRAQLQQSRCVLTEEGKGGQLAWMNWKLKDDDKQRHGFLILAKELDQEYYIHLRMKSANRGKTTTAQS
jgi:hypothetical protein